MNDLRYRIGETCAGCGKEITMLEGSYYRKDSTSDIGQTFHSMCGDPFGIEAKNAKIKRLTNALTEIASWTSDVIAKRTAQNALMDEDRKSAGAQ